MASTAAAAVVSAIFFVFAIASGLSFRLTRFKLYLLVGLSCILRGVAYANRAATPPSTGTAAAYSAFSSAGLGISVAVICIWLGCWWKNAAAATPLRSLSLYSRLLLVPVIVLGPICGGIVYPILVYSQGTPQAVDHANHMVSAIIWGIFAVLVIQLANSLLGASLAWRQQGPPQAGKGAKPAAGSGNSDLMVLVTSACTALLLASLCVRIVTRYRPALRRREDVLYGAQVLLEYLELLLVLWPRPRPLLVAAALGSNYDTWRQQMHSGQAAALEAPAV